MKIQSLVHCHLNSPRKKNFNTKLSAGKCICLIFQDNTGIFNHDYMVKGIKSTLRLMWKPQRGWNIKSIMFIGGKNWCFTTMMSHPTLVLQFQWWQTTSDLKLAHIPPRACIWHQLTPGLQLSRNISKEFILHVMKTFMLLWENGFKNSLKSSTVTT